MTEIEALLLSVAVEAPVVYALVRAARWPCRGPGHVAAAIALATAGTHPQLWHMAPWLYDHLGYAPGLALGEGLVALAEAVVVAWAAKLPPVRALAASVVANGASLLIGLLLPS